MTTLKKIIKNWFLLPLKNIIFLISILSLIFLLPLFTIVIILLISLLFPSGIPDILLSFLVIIGFAISISSFFILLKKYPKIKEKFLIEYEKFKEKNRELKIKNKIKKNMKEQKKEKQIKQDGMISIMESNITGNLTIEKNDNKGKLSIE